MRQPELLEPCRIHEYPIDLDARHPSHILLPVIPADGAKEQAAN